MSVNSETSTHRKHLVVCWRRPTQPHDCNFQWCHRWASINTTRETRPLWVLHYEENIKCFMQMRRISFIRSKPRRAVSGRLCYLQPQCVAASMPERRFVPVLRCFASSLRWGKWRCKNTLLGQHCEKNTHDASNMPKNTIRVPSASTHEFGVHVSSGDTICGN